MPHLNGYFLWRSGLLWLNRSLLQFLEGECLGGKVIDQANAPCDGFQSSGTLYCTVWWGEIMVTLIQWAKNFFDVIACQPNSWCVEFNKWWRGSCHLKIMKVSRNFDPLLSLDLGMLKWSEREIRSANCWVLKMYFRNFSDYRNYRIKLTRQASKDIQKLTLNSRVNSKIFLEIKSLSHQKRNLSQVNWKAYSSVSYPNNCLPCRKRIVWWSCALRLTTVSDVKI